MSIDGLREIHLYVYMQVAGVMAVQVGEEGNINWCNILLINLVMCALFLHTILDVCTRI